MAKAESIKIAESLFLISVYYEVSNSPDAGTIYSQIYRFKDGSLDSPKVELPSDTKEIGTMEIQKQSSAVSTPAKPNSHPILGTWVGSVRESITTAKARGGAVCLTASYEEAIRQHI
ncbi:Uncharacterized protein Fot_24589 [Forsythia ovata]|uniref:Uncharacterized protein n=1 Tax=Forsythia ovata TaxID=205694 RepID=A0ABD1U6M5_9LAMI